MRKGKTPLRLWAVLFWLLVWQIAAMAMAAAYRHGGLLLASPLTALGRLLELAATGAFWAAVGRSAASILGGFLLACLLGTVCAALAARFRRVRELLGPLVAAVKAVPVVSFIILALFWLDTAALPLFISALMVFPPVYLNVLEGIGRAEGGGDLPAGGAALLPLGGVPVPGPLLEGRGGGGGHRTACRHHRRAAVYCQGVLRDRGPVRLDGGDRGGVRGL